MNTIGETILDLSEVGRNTEKRAIWKSKDADQCVTVMGDLGFGPDGRHYVSVQNTLRGIPVDELDL